jgi:hypothetical protein
MPPDARSRWVQLGERGWKLVLGIFAAVGVITGAVTGVLALVPDGSDPPARVSAEITGLEVRPLGLSEFDRRAELARAVPHSVMLAVVAPVPALVQESVEPLSQEQGPQEEVPGDLGTGEASPGDTEPGDTDLGETGTEETVPDGTTTEETTTDETTPEPLGRSGVSVLQQEEIREISEETTQQFLVPPQCRESLTAAECPMRELAAPAPRAGSYVPLIERDGEEQVRNAARVRDVMELARSRPAAGGKREVLGVAVEVEVRLVGFAGRTAFVHWSLYSKRTGRPVPADWQRRRLGGKVTAQSQDDTKIVRFFVPLPPRRSLYYADLSVYDEEGSERAGCAPCEAATFP